MRFLFRLLLLVIVLVGLVWLFREPLMDRLGQRAKAEAGRAERGVGQATDDLDVSRIESELKQTGRVVRRKAQEGLQKLDDATRDARTSAKIKARIALDPNLSARDIKVDTTEGRVTLSGRADSPDQVARAMKLALEEDNVVEVTSTIQVRGKGAENPPVTSGRDVAPGSIPSPTPRP